MLILLAIMATVGLCATLIMCINWIRNKSKSDLASLETLARAEALVSQAPTDVAAYVNKLAGKLRLCKQLRESVQKQPCAAANKFIRVSDYSVVLEAQTNVNRRADAALAFVVALKNVTAEETLESAEHVCEKLDEVSAYIDLVICGLSDWLSAAVAGEPITEKLINAVVDPKPVGSRKPMSDNLQGD